MASNSSNSDIYIYELPYKESCELYHILDQDDKWQELAGIHMKYDTHFIEKIKIHIKFSTEISPTRRLLNLWGDENHTVLELYILLSKMHLYRAMTILLPFVDKKYHVMLHKGELSAKKAIHEPNCSNASVRSNLQSNGNNVLTNKQIVNNINGIRIATNNINHNFTTPNLHDKPIMIVPKSNSDNNSPSKQVTQRREFQYAVNDPKICNRANSFHPVDSCTPYIKYDELTRASNSWSEQNIIGRGGFGTVFKGNWRHMMIAIKKLNPPRDNKNAPLLKQQMEQSLQEIKCLNTFRHDNILQLYGYSMCDGNPPCLVYKYMENGSLENRLLCLGGSAPLPWTLRLSIATGVANGLQFIHSKESRSAKPLIHGDIKSANILLDKNFEPKIGDFGLARDGPTDDNTHVTVSRIHGTFPYLPIEFIRSKKYSPRVDIYSFGIVLFEIATGLLAYDKQREKPYLRDYVTDKKECLAELADPKAGPESSEISCGLLSIGIQCIDRPRRGNAFTMELVLEKLMLLPKENDSNIHLCLQRYYDVQNEQRFPLNEIPRALNAGSDTRRPKSQFHNAPEIQSSVQNNSPRIDIIPPSSSSGSSNTNSISRFSARTHSRNTEINCAPSTEVPAPIPTVPPAQLVTAAVEDLPLISALGIL